MSNEQPHAGIFQRLQAGELLRKDDPEYGKFAEVVSRTIRLCVEMNATATNVDEVRKRLSAIIGKEIDASTTVFPPFYTNFGRFITLGEKRLYQPCLFFFWTLAASRLKMRCRLAPRVNMTSENHPLDPADRQTLIPKPVVIKRNAWIGAGATILPGVTVGRKRGCGRRCSRESGCTTQYGRCRCSREGDKDDFNGFLRKFIGQKKGDFPNQALPQPNLFPPKFELASEAPIPHSFDGRWQ